MKDQTITLEGEGLTSLPKFHVRYKQSGSIYVDDIKLALNPEVSKGSEIESVKPVKIDTGLFATAEGWCYDMEALVNSFLYATRGIENFNHDLSDVYSAFDNLIKTMEMKVDEIREAFTNNYEILEGAESGRYIRK